MNAAPDANTQVAAADSKNILSDSSGSSNGGNDPASSGGTNSAKDSIGTVQGVNADPNLNTQAAAADSKNNSSQSGTNNGSGSGSSGNTGGSNSANKSIGTVQDVNATPTIDNQVSVLDSQNNNTSSGSNNGGTSGNSGGSNNANGSIGTVQGVDLSPNLDNQIAVGGSTNNNTGTGGNNGGVLLLFAFAPVLLGMAFCAFILYGAIATVGLYAVGWTLFGIAALRARAFPRAAALLLLSRAMRISSAMRRSA